MFVGVLRVARGRHNLKSTADSPEQGIVQQKHLSAAQERQQCKQVSRQRDMIERVPGSYETT